MVLVKSVDLDSGTVLGSSFHETDEDHCVSYQITYGKEMSEKGGKYIDRVEILPLDILKCVIENAYMSKRMMKMSMMMTMMKTKSE